MNNSTVIKLAVVVAVVLAVATWVSVSRHDRTTAEVLWPDLKSQLDQVTGIRVYGPGNERRVEVVRAQDGWQVSERSQYPASNEKVRGLLLDLAEAKLVEEKTSNPDNYAALGVEDVTAQNASSTRVELVGAKGIDLIVGKNGPSMESRYVRRANEKASWLIDRSLDVPTDANQWLESQLLDIASDRVQSARIEIKGKQAYTAAKSKRADDNFAITDLKKGQSLSSEGAANGLGSALSSLYLEDVARFGDWQDKAPHAKATYTTFEGVRLELTGWSEDAAHHIRVRASFDEAVAKQFAPGAEKPEEQTQDQTDKNDTAKKVEDEGKQLDQKSEAEALDARLKDWVFQIPEYKYNAIFPPLDGMLKK